jgi:hypothetical protein
LTRRELVATAQRRTKPRATGDEETLLSDDIKHLPRRVVSSTTIASLTDIERPWVAAALMAVIHAKRRLVHYQFAAKRA